MSAVEDLLCYRLFFSLNCKESKYKRIGSYGFFSIEVLMGFLVASQKPLLYKILQYEKKNTRILQKNSTDCKLIILTL